MASPIAISHYLIRLSGLGEEPDYLTQLRLQKLLYYAQGHSLALRKRPLFDAPIEAWTHGPVVREVYRQFKKYGNDSINPEREPFTESLDPADLLLVDSVWEHYRDFSASKLLKMTHEEPPWREARDGFPAGSPCEVEISQTTIKSFFEKSLSTGPDSPAEIWASYEECLRGETISLEELCQQRNS